MASTPARAKRLAPRPDGPLTHSASPRGETCRLIEVDVACELLRRSLRTGFLQEAIEAFLQVFSMPPLCHELLAKPLIPSLLFGLEVLDSNAQVPGHILGFRSFVRQDDTVLGVHFQRRVAAGTLDMKNTVVHDYIVLESSQLSSRSRYAGHRPQIVNRGALQTPYRSG